MARRALDRYLTNGWATQALLDAFPQIRGELLLDPCAGDGRMSRALVEDGRFACCVLNDIDPAATAEFHFDACDEHLYEAASPVDWVVTNPAFLIAGDMAALALRRARVGVALLLRCTFLEPCGASRQAPRNGRKWLTERPPTALLCLPRISFTGDGATDSAGCWWMVWGPVQPGIRVVDTVSTQPALPGVGQLRPRQAAAGLQMGLRL